MSLPNKESIALGARLHAVRIANGYRKAKDFQNKLDLSPTLHYQWEIGRRIPSDDILLKISKACHVSFEWLKTGNDDIFQGINLERKIKKEKTEIIKISERFAKEKLESRFKEKLDMEQKHKLLNQALLTAIIEQLTQTFITAKKPVDPKQLAQFSIQAYTDIVTNQPDEKQQMNLIDLTLNGYKRFIQNG